MNRGSDVSWTAIEKPITAGTECSYNSPVAVLPANQPTPYPV